MGSFRSLGHTRSRKCLRLAVQSWWSDFFFLPTGYLLFTVGQGAQILAAGDRLYTRSIWPLRHSPLSLVLSKLTHCNPCQFICSCMVYYLHVPVHGLHNVYNVIRSLDFPRQLSRYSKSPLYSRHRLTLHLHLNFLLNLPVHTPRTLQEDSVHTPRIC